MSLAPFAALVVIACSNTHTGVRANKASLADTYKTPVVTHEGAAGNDHPPLVFTEQERAPIARNNGVARAPVSFKRG